MIINNVGFNHCHDADFIIERPEGSGDELLLLIKTEAVFTIDGKDIRAPQDSVFYYPKSRPQFYRCIPQHTFDNDWIHFELDDEERALLHLTVTSLTLMPRARVLTNIPTVSAIFKFERPLLTVQR